MLAGERAEHDLPDARALPPHLAQRRHERVRGGHLVVAIRTDDEEVPRVEVRHQILQEREARRVGPLEIVEEEHEGVLLPGEHPDEVPEDDAEPVLRLDRRQLGGRRLRGR